MAAPADRLRDSYLEDASNDLALKHQELADRQGRGLDITNTTAKVSLALERVEALQEGVSYKEPRHPNEQKIADIAAQIVVLMLNGEGAADKHTSEVLDALENIRAALPGDEEPKFVVFRQGAPYQRTGLNGLTPTSSFDLARTVIAKSHEEAIEKVIARCDEADDHYGEWPPVQDGEVLGVVELRHRQINMDKIWIERVKRPIFQGEAPRDNSEDPRFA